MIIRPIEKNEIMLLTEFLYEAIFQKDINNLAPRTIIQDSSLWVYVEEFGTKKDDHCFVAEIDGKIVGLFGFAVLRLLDTLLTMFLNLQYPPIRNIVAKELEQL